MGYHAGVGANMAALGFKPCEPHITCDECGNALSVYTRRGDVAQWFMRRRNAPGWQLTYKTDGGIWAHCPACISDDKESG